MFETVLDEYYEWRGWDKRTGLQTRKKLEELGLEDVADVLAREKALADSYDDTRPVHVVMPAGEKEPHVGK
jgi:hypothetical protein